MTLKAVAQLAVGNSPEVLARYHNFRAAGGELAAVSGALLPQVDLIGSTGERQRNDPGLRGRFREETRTLQVTQTLWDGLSSYHQRRQFSHTRRVRLFEFVDASEQAALEAARAYYDVQRYRFLVLLAEENVVQHRSVWEQLEQRVTAGVGRRVDLQQATGRLALAESNLRVEVANLHDVSARFLRVVGVPPAERMEEPSPLLARIPATVREVLSEATVLNPQVRAAVENVRSASFARDARRSSLQPRVQLQLKEDRGQDINGLPGQTRNSSAMVLFNWNLFSGFADTGRIEQAEGLLDAARSQREKACRDVRQTLAIAMNDMRKLDEQAVFLRQHRQAVERARDAYRQQFDIGQRSLLDLLDTENEVFQSRRAEGNADFDLKIAYARVHAGIGRLLYALELSPKDASAQEEAERWSEAGVEQAELCAPQDVETFVTARSALEDRVEQLLRNRAVPLPQGAPGAPGVPAAPQAQGPQQEVLAAVRAWIAAWSSKDLGAYFGAYAPDFVSADGMSRADWEAARTRTLRRAGAFRVLASNEQVTLTDETSATVRFLQSYTSSNLRDEVQKTLLMKKVDGRWLIAREAGKPAPPEAFGVEGRPAPAAPAGAAPKPAPDWSTSSSGKPAAKPAPAPAAGASEWSTSSSTKPAAKPAPEPGGSDSSTPSSTKPAATPAPSRAKPAAEPGGRSAAPTPKPAADPDALPEPKPAAPRPQSSLSPVPRPQSSPALVPQPSAEPAPRVAALAAPAALPSAPANVVPGLKPSASPVPPVTPEALTAAETVPSTTAAASGVKPSAVPAPSIATETPTAAETVPSTAAAASAAKPSAVPVPSVATETSTAAEMMPPTTAAAEPAPASSAMPAAVAARASTNPATTAVPPVATALASDPAAAPTAGASASAAAAESAAAAAASAAHDEVMAAMRAWMAAWTAKDLPAYFGAYTPDFVATSGARRAEWEATRTRVLGRAGTISVVTSDEQLRLIDGSNATLRFVQRHASDARRDEVE